MSLLQSSSLVKQLTNRLETSNVAERITALQELQTIAKSMPHVVGELGCNFILFLNIIVLSLLFKLCNKYCIVYVNKVILKNIKKH